MSSLRLKVAEAGQEDVGRGIVQVSDAGLAALDPKRRDVVPIFGGRETRPLSRRPLGRPAGGCATDGLAGPDKRQRQHGGLRLGAQGRLTEFAEGDPVPFALGDPHFPLSPCGQRGPDHGRSGAEPAGYRPGGTYPEELLWGLLGSLAIGCGEVPLIVEAAVPSG